MAAAATAGRAAASRGAGVASYQRGRAATISRAGRAAPGTKRAVAGRAAETYITAKAVTPRVPRVRVRDQGGVQRPVVTSMVVIVGAGFLHAWLVEKRTAPTRSFLVRMTVMGFVLALMAELAPKLGKTMAYLVMTAVIFDRSQDILAALRTAEQPATATAAPAPFTQTDIAPVVLYSRTGPMPAEPVLPARTRTRRPRRGALYLS